MHYVCFLTIICWVQESCNSLDEREYESSCKVWTGTRDSWHLPWPWHHSRYLLFATGILPPCIFLPFDQAYTTSLTLFYLLCVEKPGSGAGEGGADRSSEGREDVVQVPTISSNTQSMLKSLFMVLEFFSDKLQVIITNYPSFFLPYYL